MPKAFILMPFSSSFDDIFNMFIAETLIEAGYSVFRADDINNSQNILSDIIQSITTSDLIVADLTGANPNVFYELGISHALNRPTIMLTQEISELPFDLRAYRVIPYSTDFVKIRDAKHQLYSLASEALLGKVQFGNPVADFSRDITPSIIIQDNEISQAGFLDHMSDLESSLEEIASTFVMLASETELIGAKTNDATQKFQQFSGNANERRLAVKGYALELSNYSGQLKSLNASYASALFKHEKSVNNVLSSKSIIENEESKIGMVAFLEGIQTAENGAIGFLSIVKDLCATMESTPDIERTLIHSRNATTKELHILAQNLEKTISVFSRTRAIASGLICDFDAKTGTPFPIG